MSLKVKDEGDLKFEEKETPSYEEKPYPCDKCFEIFDTEKSLEKHKITETQRQFIGGWNLWSNIQQWWEIKST